MTPEICTHCGQAIGGTPTETAGIDELLRSLPSDKHYGNRTTIHQTEVENERFDQGFNDCLSQIKTALKRIKYNEENRKRGGTLGPYAPPIPKNYKPVA